MLLSLSDPWAIVVIVIGLALGGFLKGATGAGLPVIAVPVIAAFLDVRTAVVVMVIPNFIVNVMQLWKYRDHEWTRGFTLHFVGAGVIGAAIGTFMLVSLPVQALQILMAAVIFLYIALRLTRPSFHLSQDQASRWAWAGGGGGGILQGAAGISAPSAVTYLNAAQMPRPSFVFTASWFFAAMCIPQFLIQASYGLVTPQTALLAIPLVLPIMAAIPLGDWLGKRMSATLFDRVILVFLAILAVKLLIDSGLFG